MEDIRLKYIDEKFKEVNPDATVDRIKEILQSVGVETREKWKESGLDNCHSLIVLANDGAPTANG